MSEPLPAGRVVCVGGAVVDRLLHLRAPAVAGTSNPARAASSFGGVARNVAENLARLGVDVALVSCVGEDAAGTSLLGHAAAAGIDVAGVRRVSGATTAEYVAVLDPGGELVLGVAAMDVLDAVAARDLLPVLARGGARWVFLDANLVASVLAGCLAAARAAGARVAVDAVSTAKVTRLPRDLSGVDVVFCNLDEARALLAVRATSTPQEDQEVGAAVLRFGPDAVVLTRGARGPLVLTPRDIGRLHVAPAEVVDVTGAGDALVAGTLAGLVRGDELATAVVRGTQLAALTLASEHSVRPDLSPGVV